MKRTSEPCGVDYDARSSRSRYCSNRCRGAAGYARRSGVTKPSLTVAPPLPDDGTPSDETGPFAQVPMRDLRGFGVENSIDGLLALILARAIDGGGFTGSGLTALTREFTRVWTDIRQAAEPPKENPLSELIKRREARRLADSQL